MRLIGQVLALALGFMLAPIAAAPQQAEKVQSQDFAGGVLFVERIDAMTDEKVCSVYTAMRGVQAVVSGTSVAFFVHERRGPVARSPASTLRLGQNKPIPLTATDRPYVIGVSKGSSREIIEALYSGSRIIVRWYDLRRDEHTMTLEIGDFGAAYDHAVATCGWPRLAAKRRAFVPPPPVQPSQTEPLRPNLSDFPYTFYIRQISEKIRAQWDGRAIPGQQPVVIFEIRRDGRLNQVTIDNSSGNAYYDQAAIRAINDAGPFPPLPDDFKEPTLVVKLLLDFGPPASVKVLLPDGRGGIEGEPILLDSTDPAYAFYLNRVRRMIKEKWGYPCVKDKLTEHCDYKSASLVIEFGIFKDGRVAYVTVIEGAKWEVYADYAVNAIRLAGPLPPVPPELIARAAPGSPGVRVVARFAYVAIGSALTNILR